MGDTTHTIIYTQTDEAPALATVVAAAGHRRVHRRRRRGGRAPRHLPRGPGARLVPGVPHRTAQRVPDDLAELGRPGRAARGQRHQAAQHLRLASPSSRPPSRSCASKGYAVPEYPDEPKTTEEHDAKARYDKVKGTRREPGAA